MPQIYFEKLKSFCNADIYIWQIEENCDELSELIADGGILLEEAEKRFKSTNRKKEWLAARALLLETPYKGEKILYHRNGKPYLTNNKYISISHTYGYVAIAISNHPVGIDLETKERKTFAAIKSYLKPQEIDVLSLSNNQAEESLLLWCAKEAAFKLAPEKAIVLKDIGITKNTNAYIVTYADETAATCKMYISENFVLSYCE